MEDSSFGCICLSFFLLKGNAEMNEMIPKGLECKVKWQRSPMQWYETWHQPLQALLSPLSWWLHTPSGVQPASGILDISCHNTCRKKIIMLNDLNKTAVQLPPRFRKTGISVSVLQTLPSLWMRTAPWVTCFTPPIFNLHGWIYISMLEVKILYLRAAQGGKSRVSLKMGRAGIQTQGCLISKPPP